MEIVINNCFGGFSLSIEGEKEYAKMKGFELFFYEQTGYKHLEGEDEYKKVVADGGLLTYSIKKDLGDTVKELPKEDSLWFTDREIDRNDSDLIKMVKEDSKKYSGRCASLKIVEIPDDAEWQIEEYDGSEHIAEKHRIWR